MIDSNTNFDEFSSEKDCLNQKPFLVQENKDGIKRHLEIKKDAINNRSVFYLRSRGQLIDSIVVNNISFTFDSFTAINDSMWHYIYSTYPLHQYSKLYNQLLIGQLNGKIHFFYVGTYLYMAESGINIYPSDYLEEKYQLNLVDSSRVQITYYKLTKEIDSLTTKIDSIKERVSLNYNSKEHIYYNTTITLDSEYVVRPQRPSGKGYDYNYKYKPNDIKRLYFDSLRLSAISMPGESYIFFYFKDRWFTLGHMSNRYIDPLPDIEYKEFTVDSTNTKKK
ncbi:MAG: hypothetical protein HYU69_09535 [Bacteroidetes bacterium]|nr:hypothetical protein [Bacteroidota bacterium]